MAPHDSTHPFPAYYSFINPKRMKGWVGLVGWPVAITMGHLLAAGRARDRESLPATDRHSTTVPHNHVTTTWLSPFYLTVNACWGPASEYMHINFGANSSIHFPFGSQRHTHRETQTYAVAIPMSRLLLVHVIKCEINKHFQRPVVRRSQKIHKEWV